MHNVIRLEKCGLKYQIPVISDCQKAEFDGFFKEFSMATKSWEILKISLSEYLIVLNMEDQNSVIIQYEKLGISRNRIMCYHETKYQWFYCKRDDCWAAWKTCRVILRRCRREFFSFSLIFCPSLKSRNTTT